VPCLVTKPAAASSLAISRNDRLPPVGRALASFLARATSLWVSLGDGLPALYRDARTALPIAGASELGDQHGLLELGHGAEHLPDESGGRRIVEEGGRAGNVRYSTLC
jgi:hypothetical protein